MSCSRRRAFTLVELLVVVGILAVLIAFLLLGLSRVQKSALAAKLASDYGRQAAPEYDKGPTGPPVASRPRARVKSFTADVELTPRLSVGTAEPESIYEAKFSGEIRAVQPADQAGE